MVKIEENSINSKYAERERLKLQQEILNVKQEIGNSEKIKETEQKTLNIGWSCFGTFGFLSLIMGVMGQEDKRWWVGFAIMFLFFLLGLWIIISYNVKLKKTNSEIERLKKQEKESRNSIR